MLKFIEGMYVGKEMFNGLPVAYLSIKDDKFISIIKKLQSMSCISNALLSEYILYQEICKIEQRSITKKNISPTLSIIKLSLITSITMKTACFFDETKGSYSLSRLFNELSAPRSRSCIILAGIDYEFDENDLKFAFSEFQKCKRKLKKLKREKNNLRIMRNSILAHFDEDFISGHIEIMPDAGISSAIHWVLIFIHSINRYAMFRYCRRSDIYAAIRESHKNFLDQVFNSA